MVELLLLLIIKNQEIFNYKQKILYEYLIKSKSFFQTHPNIDKKLFMNESLIGLKNSDRPFPANQDVGVLKWRYTSTDSTEIPLTSKILQIDEK